MTDQKGVEDLVRWLGLIGGGSLRAEIGGALLAEIDGEGRNVTVDLDALLGEGMSTHPKLPMGYLDLWKARGVPSALARTGWQVRLRAGPHELIRLGRDVSALTGHVHVGVAALWELPRLL
ncbi:MAG: hypothetical protein ACREC5_03640 [Thermoplasmata archaeon]